VLKQIRPDQARACVASARGSALADPDLEFPAWYLQRWHFLPEGYLSRRSVAAYELLIRNMYNLGQERRIFAGLLRRLLDDGARDVLEVGCGPGRFLQAVAGAAPEMRLAGVDLSPHMLERARLRAPGADLRHADARQLPWADSRFDAVVASHLFGHLPLGACFEALAEARRVLAPGGRLYVADHAWHRRRPLEAGMREVSRRDLAGGTVEVAVYGASAPFDGRAPVAHSMRG
jgi:ubiquinone/menaquinone biosynthesis C-methylase UbiE